jgi:uncharacterized repeat protein (TIGR03803 family)
MACLHSATAALATTATESTFHTFSSDQPSQLIQASDGNFYGVSSTGGASSVGYVFQLTPAGVESVVYTFTNGSDGGTPTSGVIEGNDGNLYGANTTGGNGAGILYRLTLGGSLTPLYAFNAATDGSSAGALIMNSAGDIFGAATQGGASSLGTVFEFTHLGVFQLVHTFTGVSPDGALPNTQLLQASDGLIYGATRRGGELSNAGSLYRFDPANFASFTTISSFPPTNMGDPFYNPAYGLTEGPDGALYGMTAEGGNGYGSIYKVVPGTTPNVTLDAFDFTSGVNGGLPSANLFVGGDGNFYATTSSYGNGSDPSLTNMPNGTFFQYIPGTNSITVLYDFSFPAGNTDGTSLEGADGNFYTPASIDQIFKISLTPAIPPPVSITSTASAITLGQSFTLNWLVTNAYSQTAENCYAQGAASGNWSGSQPLSGSQLITPTTTGTFTYALTCGGVESALTTVVVNPVPVMATATPVITPGGGIYYGPKSYNITDASPGATIYYTTDGSTPTLASPVWDGFPKVLTHTTAIKAIALASPLTVSAEADATITINTEYRTCTIRYAEGFHPNPSLILNHGASIGGDTLDLTHNLPNERTSAFALPRIPVKTFATAFNFRFLNANATSADGLTFTVQAESSTAVGLAGGGLGYQGISHSLAVKFDLHNNAGEGPNSIGIFIDGAFPGVPAVDLTPSGLNLHSGHTFHAIVTSDSQFLTLELEDTQTGKTFQHVFPLPTANPFGAPTAYAGFTAGTGGNTSRAQILNWVLESAGACGGN